jgi:DNA-binding NarL/FixJ family response regulator
MKDDRIGVLVVDDHPLIREGIVSLVQRREDMYVAGQVASGREAIEHFRSAPAAVTLMDLGLPDMEGVDVIKAIRRRAPEARILVLTIRHGDADVQQALQAGARGYLLKDQPWSEIADAILAVNRGQSRIAPEAAEALARSMGEPGLTSREREVLQKIVDGLSNRDVARALGISEATVKAHVTSILSKLGVHDRTQALACALQRGLVHIDRPRS